MAQSVEKVIGIFTKVLNVGFYQLTKRESSVFWPKKHSVELLAAFLGHHKTYLALLLLRGGSF